MTPADLNVLGRYEFLGEAFSRHDTRGFSFGHWFATMSGDAVRPHLHPEAHFMFIVAGRYATRIPGEGNLIYNPPETLHRDRFESRGSFFALAIARERLEGATLPKTSTRMTGGHARSLITRLMRECSTWQADSATVAESLCLELLGAGGTALRRETAPHWLTVARDRLGDSYATAITIDDVAAATGVHPIHLTRTFRRFYGCTPGEYLRSARVARAAHLLITSDMPLSQLALESGFADQSHLTRLFRRAYGVSPGVYRRATR
jgi:AraC family transcriptional regulator